MAAEAQEKEKESGGSFIDGIRTYFREVRVELSKVSWPDRPDVISLTRIVLIVTIASALLLGALSIGMSYFLDGFGIKYPPVLAILFAIIIGVTWWTFRQDNSKSY
jgi:preprotein translocase SecE subunit